MTRPKRLILIILILSLTVGGFAWWILLSPDTTTNTLTLYGTVELRDVQLAFNEQEVVTEVLVEEGEAVEKGQVLARLEQDRLLAQIAEANSRLGAQKEILRRLTTGTRPQQIAQAEAELVAAHARYKRANRLVERLKDTSRTGATTVQDLDDARADLNVARAELNVRQKALDLAREGFRKEEIAEARAMLVAHEAQITFLQARLNDTELRAPAVGVIQSRILEPGETATPTRPAFVLALTYPKWIRAYVPEPELGHLKPGMTARVYSDSFPERAFEGRVGFISPQAEFTPKSVQTTDLRTALVYETRVWVDDIANELRLGMPVTVEVDRTHAVKGP